MEIFDTGSNFENSEEFFNNKTGSKEKIEIESEGRLMIPELKSQTLTSSTKPVIESEWESASDSVSGYTKIKMEDGYYRNSSGTELYSGHTNPSMSYPVEEEFHNFNKNAQFYPLNDNITLVIEQDERIGYVDKRYPSFFYKIKRNGAQNIQDNYYYRVFFYTDTDDEFSIS